MTSDKPGKNSLKKVSITQIKEDSILLRIGDEEFTLDFEHFPWFKGQSVQDVSLIEVIGDGIGLHWPKLDVDLEVESLRHPEKYPLKSKG